MGGDNYKEFVTGPKIEEGLRDKVLQPGVVHAIHLAEDAIETGRFVDLSDTPSEYAEQSGKFVKVNPGETGLSFQLIGASDVQPGTFPVGEFVFQSVVTGVDPTEGQHLATKEYVDLAINIEEDYFFLDTIHAIGGIYYQMVDTASGEVESTLTKAGLGSGDDQPLFNWATNSGVPGVTALPGGIFGAHIHVEKTAGTKSVNVYFEIYKREADTTETLLTTSELSATITSRVSIDIHASIPTETDLVTTDILVIKWYANIGSSGSPATVVLYAEGTNNSHLKVPVESSIFNNIYVRQDGTLPLTGNWNAGAFTITAQTLIGANVTSGVDPGHTHTVLSGGTGVSSLADHGILLGSGVGAVTVMTPLGAGELVYGVAGADPAALAAGATTRILVGGGAAAPVWTAATGSGAPVRATSAVLVTPALGTPSSGVLTNCTGLPQASVVGLTTADSPTFVGLALSGAIATPTTITTSSWVHLDADLAELRLGAETNDYTVQWDGSDAVHTIVAGDFVFLGGNVGVGIAAPTGLMHLQRSAVAGADAHDDDSLILERTGDFINMNLISTVGSYLMFSDATRNIGSVAYFHTDDSMRIRTNGTDQVTITSVGGAGFGTLTIPHGGVGYAKIAIEGANVSSLGPHVQFTTAADNYPIVQILPYGHDDINIGFDAYYDGTWRSSDPGSSYRIKKGDGVDFFKIQYDVAAAGAAITWNDGIVLDITGGVHLPNIKSGINQGAAGAAAGELWFDTDDGNTVKMGV